MEKLSVIIITYNEEEHIERCLKSVQWADEIVVLDSFSTDATVDICRRYTDRVFQMEWQGYGGQKNLAAEKASHTWILNLDADEEVSSEVEREIRTLMEVGPMFSAYDFPRKNFFGEHWIRFCGWYPDRIIRLYDKMKARFTEGRVHEKIETAGGVGSLNEPLLHHSFRDMEDYITRQNRYSTLSAQDRFDRKGPVGIGRILLGPPWVFIKVYILRQGFREGRLGFFIAASMAFYSFLKYIKTHECKVS
ncbi:MAG: hypothetical protein COV66_13025 [Nitrospinae bacterium CG11_big_fil_rev_8_21_14_0_20_45_15]|nr:MAG: hypothetical protein COV66_13025 [Nitrospinae bacterium CG11_big_fil_rev_8_21_14_0_20_45_15]